jgi:hypothetical protein
MFDLSTRKITFEEMICDLYRANNNEQRYIPEIPCQISTEVL